MDVVPEAATLYHQYGARLPFGQPASRCGQVSESERNLLWECLLNELKRTLETRTVNAALRNPSPRPSIVLCDRGIFDSRAYLPTAREWHSMLELAGWQESDLAARYDQVFHLRMCPRSAYTSANNEARRETYEEALALDSATWAAWEGTHAAVHNLVGGVDGDDSMEGKLAALTETMQQRVALCTDATDAAAAGRDASADGALAPTPTAKRRGWYLPPEAIIALADTVAAAPDLGQVAPTAISIVRRVARVDAMLPARRGRAADECRESAWRSAASIGEESGLSRPPAGEDPDGLGKLAF